MIACSCQLSSGFMRFGMMLISNDEAIAALGPSNFRLFNEITAKDLLGIHISSTGSIVASYLSILNGKHLSILSKYDYDSGTMIN